RSDVSFIRFNFAAKLATKEPVLHCKANAMQHEPGGLLRYANRSVKFVRTDSVLGIGDQPKSSKPFVESDRTIFQDCADLYRKLFLGCAMTALPNLSRRNKRHVFGLAAWTFNNASRPAERHEEIVRSLFV